VPALFTEQCTFLFSRGLVFPFLLTFTGSTLFSSQTVSFYLPVFPQHFSGSFTLSFARYLFYPLFFTMGARRALSEDRPTLLSLFL